MSHISSGDRQRDALVVDGHPFHHHGAPQKRRVVVAHFDGHGITSQSSLSGAFLGVHATGPGQAVAVGVRGTVARVSSSGAGRWTLDPRFWLRAVWASSATDVWIVGDGSSIYHFDGRRFGKLDARVAGRAVAFTGVGAAPSGDVWVVGPSGIFRIRPR
jgi:hypothetical protein